MNKIYFRAIEGRSAQYFIALVVFGGLAAIGMLVTYLMYDQGLGHDNEYLGRLTGMNSRVPWGLGIVMAVYYIGLSAGSLVISALSSVFGQKEYKPFGRMGVYLSILLIIAALMSIILDWGRPDRFVNPFIYFNPSSMFSINTLLYSAYIFIGFLYLLAMFAENEKWVGRIALLAVFWAVLVHSGTGFIFGGTLRELYESPLLVPSFVVAALSSGTALIILVIQITFKAANRKLDTELIKGLSRLLAVFILVVFYFVAVENIFRSYVAKSREAEWYFLFGENFHQVLNGDWKAFFTGRSAGNIHHFMFWIGLILVGTILPALILFIKKLKDSITWINLASLMVVVGVLCERYIIVIPGQTNKVELIKGAKVIFKDSIDKLAGTITNATDVSMGVAQYNISLSEYLQAIGIGSLVVFAFLLGVKLFDLLPTEAKALSTESPATPSSPEQEKD